MPAYRSKTSTAGRNMAGARSLWRATGMKDEDFQKPIIAVVNSFTQFVPGHVHLKDLGQLVAREIEAAGGGPLACLLHDHLGIADRQIRIEQGWLMQPPSPSLIQIDLETNDAGVSLLMVGGAAHVDRSTIVDIE